MAHVGKNYKVQFRRDLSSKENNRDGWPEAFDFNSSDFGGTLGFPLNHLAVKLFNLLTDAQPPMVWTSDPVTVGGVPLRFILSVNEPSFLTTATTELEIIRTDTGVTLFKSTGPTLHPEGTFGDIHCFNDTFPVQTSLISALGDPMAYHAIALQWGAYNP